MIWHKEAIFAAGRKLCELDINVPKRGNLMKTCAGHSSALNRKDKMWNYALQYNIQFSKYFYLTVTASGFVKKNVIWVIEMYQIFRLI